MNTAQGLLSSHTSAQTPTAGNMPFIWRTLNVLAQTGHKKPLFPEITSTSLFPRIRLLAVWPSQIHYRKILLLQAKHIAKAQLHLPEPDSKQSLFQALALLPSSVAQSGAMGVPLRGDGKKDKPTLPKGCNFLQPSGLQQALVGGILGN